MPGSATAAVSSNPYLQSMYAAAAAANAAAGNPYATATGIPISAASGMIPLGAATAQTQLAGLSGVQAAAGQSTGNPLLDAYAGQYAALAAAQGMYGSQAAVAGQQSINGLDASQAGKILYLGFTNNLIFIFSSRFKRYRFQSAFTLKFLFDRIL